MKRVLVFAPPGDVDREPSYRVRLLAMKDAMLRRGFEWHFRVRPKSPWGRIWLEWQALDFDAVIVNKRMLDPYEARFLRWRAGPSRRICLDVDDAVMYHETPLGRIARRRLDRRFAATSRVVDHVCAGNNYLRDIFERQGCRVTVLPTVVEPTHYRVREHCDGKVIRLMWIGSRTTRLFLEAFMGSINEAARLMRGQGRELRLVTICDQPPQGAALPVDFIPWSAQSETQSLALGDIAIAPTVENRFTLGKCGFKIVQCMAAGLPVVASPVGANVDLVMGERGEEPAGILAGDQAYWLAAIQRLADSPELRTQMGGTGRRRVETRLCVEVMADRWAQVLNATN